MALLAARLGYDAVPVKADAPIMRVFAAGHRIENEVLKQEWLAERIEDRQFEVRLPVTGRIHVVGHIDGHDVADDTLIEVKSQNEEEWDRFSRDGWEAGFFPKYKWQTSVYMHATGLSLKLIRALRDKDGDWTGDTQVSYISEPFYTIADIRTRVLKVEAAAATGVLNAECTPSFPCPYFYLHDEVDRELITDDGVDILAREYAEASRDENIAKGRKSEARRGLRTAIDKDKCVTTSGVKVSFYTAANPPKLDREMLSEVLVPIGRDIDEFMVQGKSERIKVTLPKDKDEDETRIGSVEGIGDAHADDGGSGSSAAT